MIRLDNAGTRALSLITAQNGADVSVGFSDFTISTGAYVDSAPTLTTISSATTTAVCATPASGVIRDIDYVNIKNTYAGSHAMTLQITSGSGGPFVQKKFTLEADESANYAHGTGWQFFDAEGNLKVVESQPTPPLVFPGVIRMTGVSYPQAIFPDLQTGDNDLYTVPAGKRAMVIGVSVFNASAGNILWYPEVKVSGTYYRLQTTTTTATLAGVQTASISYIAEAGETIAVNVATNNDLNVTLQIVEFDSTVPLYASKVLALANGDNTIYTVPAGKYATILPQNIGTFSGTQGLEYTNASGGSRNIYWNIVPSGGSPGLTNQITATTAVNDANNSGIGISVSMEAGDFVNINTNAATATQWAWVNVMEIPA